VSLLPQELEREEPEILPKNKEEQIIFYCQVPTLLVTNNQRSANVQIWRVEWLKKEDIKMSKTTLALPENGSNKTYLVVIVPKMCPMSSVFLLRVSKANFFRTKMQEQEQLLPKLLFALH
jgi:hypothetical protein